MTRDRDYYRRIGSKGGRTTAARHGRGHMQAIGRRGFETTTARYFHGSRAAHSSWLARAGLHQYWRQTGLPMKYDRQGNPVWPEQMPDHPAHNPDPDGLPF